MTRHPNSIGEQNRHMLDTLTDAYKAALDLSEQGYTVLAIEIGKRNPIVRIQGERKCAKLHGAVKIIHGTPGGREETWCCNHKGAQVEWRASA